MGAIVTLWTTNGIHATAARKDQYFAAAVSVDNSAHPYWLGLTNIAAIRNTGTADIVTNIFGNAFVPQTPEHFSYDLDGNLTSDGRWSYTWDAENRLVQMVANTASGPQQMLKFDYDWQGRRIRKRVWNNTGGTGTPALELQFVYDGWNLIAELDASHAVVRSYVWGLDLSGTLQGAGGVGGLLFVKSVSSPSGIYAAAFDGNGNVSALASMSDGSVAARYEYGPFGEVVRATGPVARTNPFRFSTKYQDDETDLVYYGYRYYSPSAGVWISKDPMGSRFGPNPYLMVGNRPANGVDKDGRMPPTDNPRACFCRCLGAHVVGSPKPPPGFGWYPWNGGDMYGNHMTITWTVLGWPPLCHPGQDESGIEWAIPMSGQAADTKTGHPHDIEDVTVLPWVNVRYGSNWIQYDDFSGIPFVPGLNDGKWDYLFDLSIAFTCTSSDGTRKTGARTHFLDSGSLYYGAENPY